MFKEKVFSAIGASLLSLVFFQAPIAYSIELSPTWSSCKIEFTDKEAKIKTITDCAAKHNFKLPADDSLEALQDEFKKLSSSNFDDFCFSKCWYENSNLIKDGKIVVAELETYYKTSNISKPLLTEVTKLFDECVKDTEPKFKDEKEIPCKMFAMVDFCTFQKLLDHKKHFEEICGKSS